MISRISDNGRKKTAELCCRIIKNTTPLSKVHASILISYMQILSAITVAADACAWPEIFSTFVATLGIINLDFASLIPLSSCRLILPNHIGMVMNLLNPIVIIVTFKSAAMITIRLKNIQNQEQKRKVHNFASKAILTFIILCYPRICTRVFQAFRCYQVEDSYYLEVDFRVRCFDSPEHVVYVVLATISLVIFLIGVPLWIFSVLWRNRLQLDSIRAKQMLGSLYVHYEDNFWWFECLVMTNKALLAGALTVIAPHTPLQLF